MARKKITHPLERLSKADLIARLEGRPPVRTIRQAPNGDRQHDFFSMSVCDVATKDARSIMDVAIFRLSKKDARADSIIRYDLPDGYVQVISGPLGMATIWDYDVVLMAISQLTDAANRWRRGEADKPGRVFRPHVADVLKFCRRENGGQQRLDLVGACKRLHTTAIHLERTTTTKSGRTKVRAVRGEHLISDFEVVEDGNGHPLFLEIEIPNWIYDQIMDASTPDVLTVHPDYFLITPGLGRFVYRLARRAAGKGSATYGFSTLFTRCGSTGTQKEFNRLLRDLISSDGLPEYALAESKGQDGPLLTMRHRDGASLDAHP